MKGSFEKELRAFKLLEHSDFRFQRGWLQPFQGCDSPAAFSQGSSRTRNPGLSYGIPLGFKMSNTPGEVASVPDDPFDEGVGADFDGGLAAEEVQEDGDSLAAWHHLRDDDV